VTHRLADGKTVDALRDIRGTAFALSTLPEGLHEIDASNLAEDHVSDTVEPKAAVIPMTDPNEATRQRQVTYICLPAFERPFQRIPQPQYGEAKIPAYDMIRFSVNILCGCFGGCSFCSNTEHEGRLVQSRSEDSILNEIENIRDKTRSFTGIISDLGGPTETC
jgi:radical SAM superfamily enzyme YgiQ (UPF0313 family)